MNDKRILAAPRVNLNASVAFLLISRPVRDRHNRSQVARQPLSGSSHCGATFPRFGVHPSCVRDVLDARGGARCAGRGVCGMRRRRRGPFGFTSQDLSRIRLTSCSREVSGRTGGAGPLSRAALLEGADAVRTGTDQRSPAHGRRLRRGGSGADFGVRRPGAAGGGRRHRSPGRGESTARPTPAATDITYQYCSASRPNNGFKNYVEVVISRSVCEFGSFASRRPVVVRNPTSAPSAAAYAAAFSLFPLGDR